jgi:hypothetical protein
MANLSTIEGDLGTGITDGMEEARIIRIRGRGRGNLSTSEGPKRTLVLRRGYGKPEYHRG